ncbi:MAG TPA: universal stress protein [Pirellulaceae bacterium]|nr:universal stress protein [Planctomycetales bacterium]MCB9939237.1 universal stress protein [Planctomycetaceae bacterium]HRX78462.1 universal stress protein [Pirellulaceae bacterium]
MSRFSNAPIVVPTDMSEESLAAVRVALQIAESPSRIHVLRILHEQQSSYPDALGAAIDHSKRRNAALEELKESLADAECADLKLCVEFGDPGHRIAEHAEAIRASLIVMPSHGRRGIKRLLVGSVAERVTRLAHCPVLVLKS